MSDKKVTEFAIDNKDAPQPQSKWKPPKLPEHHRHPDISVVKLKEEEVEK